MTAPPLEEMERLEREATPGPWHHLLLATGSHGTRVEHWCIRTEHEETALASAPGGVLRREDGRLIVALRNHAPALLAAARERDRLREALVKIDAIRNDIIARQGVNWSTHIYPLVAALGEAGFEGETYEVGRAKVLAQSDRLAKLEAVAEAARHAVIGGYVASEFDAVRAALAALDATTKGTP